ncbi:ABC transporter ATPase [Pseudofulvibacter geojedonensis]|uniref:ABC transporter ATPase n=1 Tax=Pseudofulvibacter geojedonensis TaxID=1123758 RepID=A0ABW3I308_9FLAO
MYVPFSELPDHSRVWIYQSNRRFTEQELKEISAKIQEFLENWAAHGTGLQASFEIKYERFIILAVNQDTQTATGCSIDSSVQFIQQLEKEFEVELLDKMNVAFKQGDFVNFKPLTEFKKIAKSGAVGKKTIVFNNLVTNIAEYKEGWEIPAQDSWHGRFFK